jgi:transposase
MCQAISNNMRRRIVLGVKGGKTRRAVAAQFEVAPSTAVRLFARYEDTGSARPRAWQWQARSAQGLHY